MNMQEGADAEKYWRRFDGHMQLADNLICGTASNTTSPRDDAMLRESSDGLIEMPMDVEGMRSIQQDE